MSLTDFLADQSTGSWADEMEDLPSAPAAAYSGEHEGGHGGGFGDRSRGGFSRSYSRDSRYEGRDSPRDSRFSGRTERIPQPLPTSPPFTAHLGNLPFDLTENDVEDFFQDSKIANIRILRDRDDKPKGFGYVEFEDLVSLKKALDLTGQPLRNRPIRISVAEPPREHPQEDRTAGEWRRAPRELSSPSPRSDRFGSDKYGHREERWGARNEPREPRESRERNIRNDDRSPRGERVEISPRGDLSERGGFRDRGERSTERTDRSRSDTEWRGGAFSSRSSSFRDRRSEERFAPANISPPSSPHRKKLDLKPRTTTPSTVSETTTTLPAQPPQSPENHSVSASRTNKPNPFGEAKPIDTNESLRRIEERRKQKEREREEKAKELAEKAKELAEKEIAEKEIPAKDKDEEDSEPKKIIVAKENGDA
ncbi:11857_t:CDS:2 [Ambispora gerdemannii]|uniref:11857_t:CDS:1 n=1 Tax=Ambispora gerdemannii TaxID=144530 RepID=A0A9N9ARB1_9GLOM|nr:11857_t:CDS:2 [Ambispora gerdemannii]